MGYRTDYVAAAECRVREPMLQDANLMTEERKRVRAFDWKRLKNEHFMQCFQEDAALVQAIGLFLQEALLHHQAGIIVGTPEHRAGVEHFLRGNGLDPIKLQRAGVYIPLDARELLDRICQNGAPDRQRFYDVIGLLISSASNSWGSVRVFGEMVNLLWKDAKRAEALALENLWNELKKTYPFALFCAYSKDGSLEDDACFAHICEAHSMVIR